MSVFAEVGIVGGYGVWHLFTWILEIKLQLSYLWALTTEHLHGTYFKRLSRGQVSEFSSLMKVLNRIEGYSSGK